MAGGEGKNQRVSGAPLTPPPFWEKVVALVGLLLALGLLGYLGYHLVAEEDGPPDLHIQVDSIQSSRGDYLVTFTARNEGGETAADVVIEGQLWRDGTPLETAEVTLNFVPARSEREGGLFFRRDPRELQLEIRPLGYVKP